jgi:predicted negative regulator of RcsB-dependent stress response
MSSGDIFGIAVTAIIAVSTLLVVMGWRFFSLREKKLEAETALAAEKAAQYATSNAELEQRLRVLEQIVTDSGAQTAAQIEALRESSPLNVGRQARTSRSSKRGTQ